MGPSSQNYLKPDQIKPPTSGMRDGAATPTLHRLGDDAGDASDHPLWRQQRAPGYQEPSTRQIGGVNVLWSTEDWWTGPSYRWGLSLRVEVTVFVSGNRFKPWIPPRRIQNPSGPSRVCVYLSLFIYLFIIYLYLFISWVRATFRKPLPPLARLSPKSLGGRFISSRRFCWYSLSMVMAASPFPTEPVIRDTMPAAPPGGRGAGRSRC